MGAHLTLDRALISQVCRRHGVARLRIFGSALSDRFDPASSDVDFIVDFGPDATRTFRALFNFQADLEEAIGHPVDLVDASTVRNPYFAASAFTSAEELYAA